MSEYDELVDRLKFYADTADDMIYGVCVNSPKAMKAAADAIEKLVKDRNVLQLQNHLERCEHEHTRKERNAAIADLKAIASCANCIHFGRHQVHCDAIIPCLYGEESAWEWRGVQEASE